MDLTLGAAVGSQVETTLIIFTVPLIPPEPPSHDERVDSQKNINYTKDTFPRSAYQATFPLHASAQGSSTDQLPS